MFLPADLGHLRDASKLLKQVDSTWMLFGTCLGLAPPFGKQGVLGCLQYTHACLELWVGAC